jgi:hypothetical protein
VRTAIPRSSPGLAGGSKSAREKRDQVEAVAYVTDSLAIRQILESLDLNLSV